MIDVEKFWLTAGFIRGGFTASCALGFICSMPNGQTTNTYVSFDILIVQWSFNKQFRCQKFLLSVLNSSSRFNHLQEEKLTCFQRNLELLPRLFLFSSFFVAVRNITKSSICLPHVLQDGSWLPFRVQEGREWFHSGINGTWLFFFLIRLLGGTCFLFFECIYSYASVLLVFTGIYSDVTSSWPDVKSSWRWMNLRPSWTSGNQTYRRTTPYCLYKYFSGQYMIFCCELRCYTYLGVNDLGQQTSRRTAFASRSNVDWRVVPRRAIFAPKLGEVWSYLDAENRMKQLIWKLLKQIQ